ncbi:hypothetical protein R6Q57_002422 [Mikania cordata]
MKVVQYGPYWPIRPVLGQISVLLSDLKKQDGPYWPDTRNPPRYPMGFGTGMGHTFINGYGTKITQTRPIAIPTSIYKIVGWIKVLNHIKKRSKVGIDTRSKERRVKRMLLAVLIANSEGNILVERFNGVPGEERLHWRSFLVKLGADNLKGVKNEELLVACHKSVYVVYTVLGHVSIYLVGKDEYDELALSEAMFVVTSAIKDVCGKPPTERLFLDKYGRICLCLDEIVWKGLLENTDKDRIKRLIRLRPPTEF